MNKKIIFIDESGTLPDPKDTIIVLAAVVSISPEELVKISKYVRKFLKKKNTQEIKFYTLGDRTKKKFLKLLSNQNIDIFVLIIEKKGKKIEDSPENFALLSSFLLEDCLLFYKNTTIEIVFDRHFHRKKDQEKFNLILAKLLKRQVKILHVNSQEDTRVNAADIVAGSALWSSTGKSAIFFEIIKNKVVVEKRVSWKQLKARFYAIKNSSEPV